MEILIITSPFCEDFGISEEMKKNSQKPKGIASTMSEGKVKPIEWVSMESYDMIAQAYFEKCEECKAFQKKYDTLYKEFKEEIRKYSPILDERNALKKENRELTEELSRYRYFIECQKNEIEKL